MAKTISLLAGISLAIAIAAPFGDALAQRQGEPQPDPNQPRKDRPEQKPPPKSADQPRIVPQKGAQPNANPAPAQPQGRSAPPPEQRRGVEQRRDGGPPPGRDTERRRDDRPPQPPPVNTQRPQQLERPPTVQAPAPAPEQRRAPPPQADPNKLRQERQVSPPPPQGNPTVLPERQPDQQVSPRRGSSPGSSGPAVSPVRQPDQQTPPRGGPSPGSSGAAVSPVRPASTPPPAAVLPSAPPLGRGAVEGFRPGFRPSGPPVTKLEDVQRGRTQRTEAGGKRTIIQETDNRVIIKQNNTTIIRHDETQRFAKNASSVRSSRRGDGTTQTIVMRPGGVQLFNIVDNNGRLVRRYRRDDRGREVNIIDNRRFYRNAAFIGAGLIAGAIILNLREPEVRIPRDRYIVDYEAASDDDLYEALSAPPVSRLERAYSLEEVRYNVQLRDRMRRLDLDAVTFPSGSWEVGNEQFPKLERLARIMTRIINRNPGEVFFIEGHTDAVGPPDDNLTLSDRRAQAVAEILSGVFDVPPENLVTQGYGEQFLKVPSDGPDRLNRRVTVRRVTPLLGEGEFSDRR